PAVHGVFPRRDALLPRGHRDSPHDGAEREHLPRRALVSLGDATKRLIEGGTTEWTRLWSPSFRRPVSTVSSSWSSSTCCCRTQLNETNTPKHCTPRRPRYKSP